MGWPEERLTLSCSTAELERRWNLVRKEMAEKGIDYLIVQDSDCICSGTVRWFTDLNPRHGMPMTVIFPAEGEMTTIMCGVDQPGANPPAPWAARGIANRLGRCFFANLNYTNSYEPGLALPILKEKKEDPVIGIIEPGTMAMSFYLGIKEGLPKAKFIDATEITDKLQTIKSAEEIELIKGTAAIGDKLIEKLYEVVRPGIRDIDVHGELHSYLAHLGSERSIVMVGSAPEGKPAAFDTPRYQNRTIQKGDNVSILMEHNGPGGQWCEIFRPIVVGRQPSEIEKERFAAAIEAQEAVANAMVPGAKCSDLWKLHSDILESHGLVVKQRAFAHAQGYGYMLRPNLRPDETWTIQAGMNIAVHPYAEDLIGPSSMCMDNYLVTENGAVRLHKAPKEIVVV